MLNFKKLQCVVRKYWVKFFDILPDKKETKNIHFYSFYSWKKFSLSCLLSYSKGNFHIKSGYITVKFDFNVE